MKRKLLPTLLAGVLLTGGPAPAVLAQDQVLNVQNADIRAFIQDVARATDTTFIVDPRVQGTVTVASDEPLNRAELLDVLLSTLRANGLVAVPTARGAYRVVPDETAATQPSTAGGRTTGFATDVIRLRNIDARAAAEILRPLVGRGGVVQGAAQGNVLVVADYADNLRRIRGLIAQVDQDRSSIQTVTLTNSSAREIAAIINDLFATPGAPGQARNAALTVIPVESSNSVILRGDAGAIARVLPIITDLDRRAEASGDVRVVRLQHANAEQLLPVLQQLVGQTPTQPAAVPESSRPRGAPTVNDAGSAGPAPASVLPPASGVPGRRASIARYPGANALIISADPETQRLLGEVIRQVDIRREQVLVEAIVVEVSDNAARQLGVQYLLAGKGGSGIPFSATNFSRAAPGILGLAGALAGNELLPDDSSALTDLRRGALQSLAGVNGNITGVGGETDDLIFGAIINAVQNDTASNILSTPSILTLDNEEAKILVGQEVPITTGEVLGDANTNPFRTTERQDVGVQLEVKPQINAGGGITLFLRQEVSAVAGTVVSGSDLILNKREIETTVLVDDGDIVVLGGLLDQNEQRTVDKVPVLGDIPGVGALFRSNGRQRAKTNLMVFIRPTILRNPAEAQRATAPRYDYIRGAQLAQQPVRRDRVREAELDALVRDYLRTSPPVVPPPSAYPPPPPSASPAAPVRTRPLNPVQPAPAPPR